MTIRSASFSTRVVSSRLLQAESGSQTTEYALIMVVAATIASLALAWARNGAIAGLLDGVLDHVRSLFGMG
jgi:Flp pilus assembly pilin Flp